MVLHGLDRVPSALKLVSPLLENFHGRKQLTIVKAIVLFCSGEFPGPEFHSSTSTFLWPLYPARIFSFPLQHYHAVSTVVNAYKYTDPYQFQSQHSLLLQISKMRTSQPSTATSAALSKPSTASPIL